MVKIKNSDKQQNNISAIREFIEANKLESKSLLLEFKATVEYPTKQITENTRVQLSIGTTEYGKIEIINTRRISSDRIHTGFSIQWQDYRYDTENNILKIHGESDKMGGKYEVLIYPL